MVTPKLRKMDHIDPSIGLRRSLDKKMVALKVRCGPAQADILVTGETTVKKDSASNFTEIMTNMKECGPWIKNMVRAPIGEMMVAS